MSTHHVHLYLVQSGSMLLVCVGDRGSGKTSAAIDWLAARPEERSIVVPTAFRADHVQQAIRTRHPDLARSSSASNWVVVADTRYPGLHAREVWVDDAHEILARHISIGFKVHGISLTGHTF